MKIGDKLMLMKQSERRNAESIRAATVKVRMLSNHIRVVLEPFDRGFRVSAQQYVPHWPMQWEVMPDGWRVSVEQYAPTLEGARRVFEQMVRDEERWLEAQ